MNEAARKEFFARWRREAKPQIESYIARILPDLELDGQPATKAEAVVYIKHLVSLNSEKFIRGSLPTGVKLTPEEKAEALRITLELLDEIAGKGHSGRGH